MAKNSLATNLNEPLLNSSYYLIDNLYKSNNIREESVLTNMKWALKDPTRNLSKEVSGPLLDSLYLFTYFTQLDHHTRHGQIDLTKAVQTINKNRFKQCLEIYAPMASIQELKAAEKIIKAHAKNWESITKRIPDNSAQKENYQQITKALTAVSNTLAEYHNKAVSESPLSLCKNPELGKTLNAINDNSKPSASIKEKIKNVFKLKSPKNDLNALNAACNRLSDILKNERLCIRDLARAQALISDNTAMALTSDKSKNQKIAMLLSPVAELVTKALEAKIVEVRSNKTNNNEAIKQRNEVMNIYPDINNPMSSFAQITRQNSLPPSYEATQSTIKF